MKRVNIAIDVQQLGKHSYKDVIDANLPALEAAIAKAVTDVCQGQLACKVTHIVHTFMHEVEDEPIPVKDKAPIRVKAKYDDWDEDEFDEEADDVPWQLEQADKRVTSIRSLLIPLFDNLSDVLFVKAYNANVPKKKKVDAPTAIEVRRITENLAECITRTSDKVHRTLDGIQLAARYLAAIEKVPTQEQFMLLCNAAVRHHNFNWVQKYTVLRRIALQNPDIRNISRFPHSFVTSKISFEKVLEIAEVIMDPAYKKWFGIHRRSRIELDGNLMFLDATERHALAGCLSAQVCAFPELVRLVRDGQSINSVYSNPKVMGHAHDLLYTWVWAVINDPKDPK